MKKKIEEIQQRNFRVERDKAWEISFTRKFAIAAMTYIVMVVFLYMIGVQKPAINALVPTLGFILSTLSLPFLKKCWLKYIYSQDSK